MSLEIISNAYDRIASTSLGWAAAYTIMQTRNRDELTAIRDYYDHNTPRFLSYGAQRKTGTIHRPVWGEGVDNDTQALHYVHQQILNEGSNLCSTGLNQLRIADLGCGVGASLFYLARNLGDAFSGVGITISPFQVGLAQQDARRQNLTDRCTFILGDFLSPPFAREFNLIFSIESFAHTSDPEGYFRSVSQLLKPGGRLVLCDDFLSSSRDNKLLNSRQKDLLETYRWGWGVPGVWSSEHVKKLAELVGLKLIEDRDLTPSLKLRPLAESLFKFFLAVYRIGGRRDLYWRSVWGGQALQLCLSQGLVEYRYLVFER